MEIGSIGNSYLNNESTYDTSKKKAADESFESKLQSAVESKDEKQLKSVCQDFEGIFLNMMYKQMKATVPKSGLLEDDFAKDTFDEMLDEELMNQVAEGRGIGLAEVLYKQLSKTLQAQGSGEVSAGSKDGSTGESKGDSEVVKNK